VIEVLVHPGQGDFLPSRSVVAGFATLRKGAVVEVDVAIRTLAEREPRVPRLAVRARCMALFALHLRVLPGQRIARFAVIELADGDRLPVVVVVALQAIRAQTPLVLVLVAGDAALRYSEKRPRQILDLDHRARYRTDVLRGMALVTGDALMFPLQNVARQLMIEGLGIPLDERKVFPVVLRVALAASIVAALGDVVGSMQSLARAQPPGDFRMASQTLQRGCGAKFVAVQAVQCSTQRIMGAR